jgi:DNA ligase-1
MQQLTDFQELKAFVEAMNSSNSTNHKVEVLTKYQGHPFIKMVLYYTYHPLFNFGVSSDNLKKRQDLIAPHETAYDNLFNLLDDLNQRNITGHSAIQQVNRFIEDYSQYSDLIYQILDRNLETRATTTLINRVMPGLIQTFDVALAHDASKVKGVDLLDRKWFISRKLDGVRCIAIINGEDIKFFSRNGKEFHTLGRVKDEIIRLGITSGVLDGEICLMNEDGSDDFQGILKQIQRKDHTIQNPKYWVFDLLTIDEFSQRTSSPGLSIRLNHRSHWIKDSSGILELLPQIKIDSEETLIELKNRAKDLNWEGLIARRDTRYQAGRSKDMLKLKEFYDAEYIVSGVIMGPQRVIVEGREVEEEMLSAITILHKGHIVQVGSGFNMEQRRYYHKHPEEIFGKTVCIQFFEETVDQLGKPSLRFPVFKHNYGDVRNT